MLVTAIILCTAQIFYQPVYEPMPYVPQPVIVPQAEPIYSPPTHYVASYGKYYTEIPIEDPLKQDYLHPDTSREIYPERYYNSPSQRAWERAQEVTEPQREASWAE
jgi:hypothetical protein